MKEKNIVVDVLDQGMCGSCWGYAIATAASYGISLEENRKIQISPESVMSSVQDGKIAIPNLKCCGGITNECVEYLCNTNNDISSRLLSTTECQDNSWLGVIDAEGNKGGSEFNNQCDNPNQNELNVTLERIQPANNQDRNSINTKCYSQEFKDFEFLTINNYQMLTSLSRNTSARMAIQEYLINSGNGVIMSFPIYEDFMDGPGDKLTTIDNDPNNSWPNGVYIQKNNNSLGGHAVVIIGWGKDENIGDYWIIQNSWSERWGDKGFAKIAMYPTNKLVQIEVQSNNGNAVGFNIQNFGKATEFDKMVSRINEDNLKELQESNSKSKSDWEKRHNINEEYKKKDKTIRKSINGEDLNIRLK